MANNFLKIFRGIFLTPQASAPGSPADGDLYYDSVLVGLYARVGGAWVNISAGGTGNITGPGSTTLNAIATWANTGGTSLANSLVTIDSNGQISVQSGLLGLTIGADTGATTRTNSTAKTAIIGAYHYTNASAPMGIIHANTTSTTNVLNIGGGVSSVNAATSINFYAGATNTTLTGILGMVVSPGQVAIGGGTPGSTGLLTINASTVQNQLTAVTQNAIQLSFHSTSAATGGIAGVHSQITTAAAAFTTAYRAQFFADANNIAAGAGSTITADVGYLANMPNNGTNNAIFADNTAFTGNWVINSTTASPSYFAGQQIIGTNSTFQTYGTRTGNFQVSTSGGANRVSAFIHENSTSGPLLTVGVNGGAAGTYTFPTSGAILGNLAFAGANNAISAYSFGGFIFMSAASTWTATNAETKYELDLAPSGSLSTVAVHTISSAGLHTFGVSASTVIHLANGSLQINRQLGVLSAPTATSIAYIGSTPGSPNAVLSGTTQEAARIEITSNSSATARTIALTLLTNTAPSAFSTIGIGLRIQSGTIGAGSTITTNIGIGFQSPIAGGTNNACIADNEAFSGSYFINSTSTNPSVLGGSIQAAVGSGIGAAGSTDRVFRIGGTPTGAIVSQYGAVVDWTTNSSATTNASGVYSNIRTAAAAFTIGYVADFEAAVLTLGAGSSVTRFINFLANPNTIATNNAMFADNTTFSGNYFIHSVSTNGSVLGGNLAIGGGGSASTMLDIRAGGVNSGVVDFKGIQTGNFTVPSTVTSSYTSYASGASTAATAFTLAVYAGFVSNDINKGAGSTVTRSIGHLFTNPSAGGTGNATIADNILFSGNYFINSTSANPTLLSGALTAGHAAQQSTINGSFTVQDSANGTNTIQLKNTDAVDSGAGAALQIIAGASSTNAYVLFAPSNGALNWFSGNIGSNSTFAINYGGSSGSPSSTNNMLTVANTGVVTINGPGTPNLRIGTASAINSTNEQVSIEYDVTAASNTDTCAITARTVLSGNTAITAGQPQAATFRWRRSTTANTTDTFPNVVGATVSLMDINPSTGTTYTWANGASSPLASFVAYMPSNIGAGTSAVSLSAGLYIRGTSGTTGSRAVGLYMDGVSTGTNNAFISDNNTFTGNYFINSTSGNQSLLSGALAVNNTMFVGNAGVDTTTQFRVGGSNTTGTDQAAIAIAGWVSSSAATSSVAGVSSGPSTANASFTCGLMVAYNANNSPKGAASTISRHVMYYGAPPTQGSNNAFLSDNSSFSGNFFINSTSTNASVISGQFGNNGAAGGSAMVKLNGNTLTGTSQYAVEASVFTGTSAATVGIASFVSGSTTANAAFTCAARYQFFADNVTKGAASTITRDIAYFINGGPTQGANNAAIADNTTFTGNFFINQTGTTASSFGGDVITNARFASVGYQTNTPTTGTTVACNAITPGILFTPAGTIATLTIQLPLTALDGTQFWVASSQQITTVTWQDHGGTAANVIGGQATIGGTNRGQRFVWSQANTKWYAIA